MPGHIKLVKGAADLDPTEFLLPSFKMKHADQAKPYNTKKGFWIPDPNTRGYREGSLESGDIEVPASNCVFAVAHEKLNHKNSEVGKVKPQQVWDVQRQGWSDLTYWCLCLLRSEDSLPG